MAEIKPQVYKDPRPAEYFDQFHERPRQGVGWTYNFVRAIVTLPTLLIYRVRAIGTRERARRTAPLILAPNHFSQMDHFFVGVYLRRKIRFMAKSQLFGPPVLPTSSSTAASSRCAAATTTRRRSRPPTRSSTRARCC